MLDDHLDLRLSQRAPPDLQVPVLRVGVPADRAPARAQLLRQAIEERELLHGRVPRIRPPRAPSEGLERLPPAACPPTWTWLRQRAAPGCEPALQTSPVTGEGLEKIQPGDGGAPAKPLESSATLLCRQKIVQARVERADDAVSRRVRQSHPGDDQGPRHEQSQDRQSGERE